MQTVPIHQAKDRFSALLQAVEDGDEIVITRHGKKIARIVREAGAVTTDDERERLRQAALAELQAFRASVRPGPSDRKGDSQPDRDAGRR